MRVKDFDLYNNGFVEEFPSGEKYLEREIIEYTGNDTDLFHTIKDGETITQIAHLKYKDIIDNARHYWWIIADANQIENPMDLTEFIGFEIVIPDPFLFTLNT